MEGGPPSFPRDFPCPVVLGFLAQGAVTPFAYRAVTLSGGPFQVTSARRTVCNSPAAPRGRPAWSHNTLEATVVALTLQGFRLFRVRSPLLAESQLMSFPRGTEMFQFPRLPPPGYVFTGQYRGITRGGLPHSDIPGSTPACGYPRLFAARCVLHRLPTPRHPPCALSSLTQSSFAGPRFKLEDASVTRDESCAQPQTFRPDAATSAPFNPSFGPLPYAVFKDPRFLEVLPDPDAPAPDDGTRAFGPSKLDSGRQRGKGFALGRSRGR